MSDQIINVGIAFDPSGAVTGVTVAEQAFNRVGQSADKMNQKVSDGEKLWTGLKTAVAGYLTVAAGREIFGGMIREFTESEAAGLRFEAVLRATGNTAQVTMGQFKDMQNELANSTVFSDDDVVAAQTRLLTFKSIQGQVFNDATRVSADLAAVLGTDLSSAALMVGKALESPEDGLTALRRAGVVLSDTVKDNVKDLVQLGRTADAQRLILRELENRVGGTAQAMRQGLSGAIREAGKAWDEFLENAGRSTNNIGRPGFHTGQDVSWAEAFFIGWKKVLQEMTPVTDELSIKTTAFMTAADNLQRAKDRLEQLQRQTNTETTGIFERHLDPNDQVIKDAQARVDALQARADSLEAQVNDLVTRRNAITTPPVDPMADPRSQDVIKNIQDMTAAADKQAMTFGMTAAQLAAYEAKVAGATQAEQDHIYALIHSTEVAGVMQDAYAALSGAVEVNTGDLRQQALQANFTSREFNGLLDVLERIDQAQQDAADSADWLRKHAPPKTPDAPKPPERVTEWKMNEETGRMEEHVRRELLPQAMQNAMAEQEWWDRIKKEAHDAGAESSKFWEEAWTQAARNTQDILSDFIETTTSEGRASFETFMEDILRMIDRIASQMAAAGLIKWFTGIITNAALPAAPNVPTGQDVADALVDVPALPNMPLRAPGRAPGPTPTPAEAGSVEPAHGWTDAPEAAGPGSAEPANGWTEPQLISAGSVEPAHGWSDAPPLASGLTAPANGWSESDSGAAVATVDDAGDSGSSADQSMQVVVQQTLNFNISAIDTRDLEQALMKQKGTIARAVAEASQQSTAFATQIAGRKR